MGISCDQSTSTGNSDAGAVLMPACIRNTRACLCAVNHFRTRTCAHAHAPAPALAPAPAPAHAGGREHTHPHICTLTAPEQRGTILKADPASWSPQDRLTGAATGTEGRSEDQEGGGATREGSEAQVRTEADAKEKREGKD